MKQQMDDYANIATGALAAACEELDGITQALDRRSRERRIQAIREMHPKQIMELLEDIGKAAGASNIALLDRGMTGATWFHIAIGEAIGELQSMYADEIEALRNSYGEARYDISGNAVRSREMAEEDVERIDENWKWGG